MLKTLLKKELLELNRSFFYDQKRGKSRTMGATILLITLYVLLVVVVLGGSIAAMAMSMCTVLHNAALDWLYFGLFTLMAILLGTFGGAFSTYSSLYKAKDNDLLLAMPVPVRVILTARLLGVYLMGLLFSAIVLVPAIIVYLLLVPAAAVTVVSLVLLLVLTSLFVLVLSCVLGWIVAKISLKLKNKSIATVLISLLVFGLYYFFYFKASSMLGAFIENAAQIGAKLQNLWNPVYFIGQAALGSPLQFAVCAGIVLLLLFCTGLVLSRSFIGIATASGSGRKARYQERTVQVRPLPQALLAKELRRFTSSPNYMLNCGMGILLLLAGAVLLLIKGAWIRVQLDAVLGGRQGLASVLLAAVICLVSTMNDMTAPAVSLEGKSIYLLQAMPVPAWRVLQAKLRLQLLLSGVPMLICGLCGSFSLGLPLLQGLLAILVCALFTALQGCFGLFIDLKRPNLRWTNEITPVKQSMNVMFSILGGWLYGLLMGGLYFLLAARLPAELYLLLAAVFTGGLFLLLYFWLRRSGAKIFAVL